MLFLLDRTFDDASERIGLVNRRFQSALLIGCPNPNWRPRLAALVDNLTVTDPGPLFAAAARGTIAAEDQERLGDGVFDLCVAIGTLDTVNNLPLSLANIRAALRPDALLLGAVSGGDTLPALRAAMRAADLASGQATPHVHPRIDGPGLCSLLTNVGFTKAVVDVDRVSVSYSSLWAEVSDLRGMAAGNILTERSKIPLSRRALAGAVSEYDRLGTGDRTVETFEILHFAAWTPADGSAWAFHHG